MWGEGVAGLFEVVEFGSWWRRDKPSRSLIPIQQSRVVNPSDMLAFGDGTEGIEGFGWPGEVSFLAWWKGVHRDYRSNGLFCDGHVETSNYARIPRTTNSYGVHFIPDAPHAKRWNNDHQPHPEMWPKW